MSAAAAAVREVLLVLGILPTRSALQGECCSLALENGWQLRLCAAPCLHAWLVIPCALWERAGMAERLLARLDLRSGRTEQLQLVAHQEHLSVLWVHDGPAPDAQMLMARLEALVSWAVRGLG